MSKYRFTTLCTVLMSASLALVGCGSSEGLDDLRLDLGFELGGTYSAQEITLTGAVDGVVVPTETYTPYIIRSNESQDDYVLAAGTEHVFVMVLREEFNITNRVFEPGESNVFCPEACPVDVYGLLDSEVLDWGKTTTMRAERTDGIVRFTVHVTSAGGDDATYTFIAQVDTEGRLIRE